MRPSKLRRQREIRRLIGDDRIRTQDELSAALVALGIRVSQATLSRDLHELGVAKAPGGYGAPTWTDAAPTRAVGETVNPFLVGTQVAGNLVVVRTAPGGAAPVAQALDEAGWSEIVGTIAGDDTIFVATADRSTARSVKQRIDAL